MRAILTYHSIDPSGSAISVSAEEFGLHLRWLASGQVRVTSLAELVLLDDTVDAVALTFDDGFTSFAAAADALLDHGFSATVFVVTRQTGKTNAWGGRSEPGIPELPLLDWDALGRLKERGIEVGAHTRSHPSLPSLSGPALQDEVLGSARDLHDRMGLEAPSFAYPYGAVSSEAASTVKSAFDLAVTTELRIMQPNEPIHLLPRLDMYYLRQPGRLEQWGTSSFRRRLWFRSGLRRVRRLLAGGS